jgi:hypothetical protein
LEVTEQGQITDRYTRAIEQLGSDKLDVRLGGIYALERIAVDSTRDHPTVVEVLSAFVREHSDPTDSKVTLAEVLSAFLPGQERVDGRHADVSPDGEPKPSAGPATDVKAALAVLLRLPRQTDVTIDLSGANLSNADLARADLSGARLSGVKLSGAKLVEATLAGASLSGGDLAGADLDKASLSNAHLSGVNLSGANLREAILSHARLNKANLSGANLEKANLSNAFSTMRSCPARR